MHRSMIESIMLKPDDPSRYWFNRAHYFSSHRKMEIYSFKYQKSFHLAIDLHDNKLRVSLMLISLKIVTIIASQPLTLACT